MLSLPLRDRPAIERLLIEGSDLPGPRGNLALARRFGAEVATLPPADLIALVAPWLELSLADAPVGHPREFLPACAAVALGTALATSTDAWQTLTPHLQRAAHDPRWRTRGALVLGLQAAGERNGVTLLALCERWVATGDAHLMRAVVAALAAPSILSRPDVATTALRHARVMIDWLQAQPAARRATEGSAILTEALGLALSAYVVAAPGPGFQLLDDLLAGGDRATRRIVNANLGRPHLRDAFPTQTSRLRGWIFEMDDWQRG